MSAIEEKLKTSVFWLTLGTVNHLIALVIILFGCALSGFSCRGDAMSETLSIYTFTLFTPQVAVEMIILLALLLVSGGQNTLKSSWPMSVWFLLTLMALGLFGYFLI